MEDQLLQPIQVDTWQGQHTGQPPLTLREKLMKLFDATDFVRVQNIDTEPFTWQYMPAGKEHISFDTTTSTVPMKETFRDPPEIYRLNPGQSAIIVGASAFLMIEGLVKRMISEEAVSRDREYAGVRILPGGKSRKFSFADDVKQQELIDRIYLGKHIPGMSLPEPKTATIEEDLGLDNEATQAPEPTLVPTPAPEHQPEQPKAKDWRSLPRGPRKRRTDA